MASSSSSSRKVEAKKKAYGLDCELDYHVLNHPTKDKSTNELCTKCRLPACEHCSARYYEGWLCYPCHASRTDTGMFNVTTGGRYTGIRLYYTSTDRWAMHQFLTRVLSRHRSLPTNAIGVETSGEDDTGVVTLRAGYNSNALALGKDLIRTVRGDTGIDVYKIQFLRAVLFDETDEVKKSALALDEEKKEPTIAKKRGGDEESPVWDLITKTVSAIEVSDEHRELLDDMRNSLRCMVIRVAALDEGIATARIDAKLVHAKVVAMYDADDYDSITLMRGKIVDVLRLPGFQHNPEWWLSCWEWFYTKAVHPFTTDTFYAVQIIADSIPKRHRNNWALQPTRRIGYLNLNDLDASCDRYGSMRSEAREILQSHAFMSSPVTSLDAVHISYAARRAISSLLPKQKKEEEEDAKGEEQPVLVAREASMKKRKAERSDDEEEEHDEEPVKKQAKKKDEDFEEQQEEEDDLQADLEVALLKKVITEVEEQKKAKQAKRKAEKKEKKKHDANAGLRRLEAELEAEAAQEEEDEKEREDFEEEQEEADDLQADLDEAAKLDERERLEGLAQEQEPSDDDTEDVKKAEAVLLNAEERLREVTAEVEEEKKAKQAKRKAKKARRALKKATVSMDRLAELKKNGTYDAKKHAMLYRRAQVEKKALEAKASKPITLPLVADDDDEKTDTDTDPDYEAVTFTDWKKMTDANPKLCWECYNRIPHTKTSNCFLLKQLYTPAAKKA